MNPFADLPAPGGAIVKRDRFLSTAKIRQVWRALDEPERFEVSQDAATALRLILTTAARPGMVIGMTGAELRDLRGPSEHGPQWALPAKRMKAGSAFIRSLVRPRARTAAPAPQGRSGCGGVRAWRPQQPAGGGEECHRRTLDGAVDTA